MTPILTFTREELGREVATLGAVHVGEVMRFAGHRGQASYAVWLPGVPKRFVPADSTVIARSAVVRQVEEWLTQIGVFYPGESVEVRAPLPIKQPGSTVLLQLTRTENQKGKSIMFTRTQFGEEGDDAGIFIGDLGRALVIWTSMVAEDKENVTVADAALAFNTSPEIIREAVDDAMWIDYYGPSDDPTKQVLQTDGD